MASEQKTNLWLLSGILIATLVVSLIIPTELTLLPAAVDSTLPISLGDWVGKRNFDTTEEKKILMTNDIYKADYSDRHGRQINVSLVLSGQDLNNSIHRAERCLPAQGHRNLVTTASTLKTAEGSIPVAQVRSTKTVSLNDTPTDIEFRTLYWFIGHNTITASHYKRSFIDIFDRLTKGSAQQWAYVSISAPIFKEDHAEAEARLLEFARELAPTISTLESIGD